MNNLRNITMAFGVENSPTAVTKALVLTLLEVIDNLNINSTFSGHILMLTGSINAAQAYMLALKNITYHGETEAVEYNISVDKATPSEGENVTFSVVDDVMPIGVFRFGLSSISNIVGDITEEEIRSLITFDANVMRIADSGKNINWNATIKINSWLIFDEEHKQPTTLTLKGSVRVTSINVVGDEDFTVETLGTEKAYTIEFTPSDYTQPVGNPVLSCEDSRVTFKDITKNRFVAVFNTTVTFETDIIVETAGVSFTKHIKVKAVGASEVNMTGDVTEVGCYVDLGLPSHLLWAKKNIGASNEKGTGLYFAWGETEGFADTNVRKFTSDEYYQGSAAGINADLTAEQDAAHVIEGSTWRMPTIAEFTELKNNTNYAFADGNLTLTSKVNGKSIVFPSVGVASSGSIGAKGVEGYLWSKSFARDNIAQHSITKSSGLSSNTGQRYMGMNIRPVAETTPKGGVVMSFTSIGQKSATFSFDGLVPMNTATAQFESATITYSIMSCNKNGITVKCNSVDTIEENTINITFEDVEGNVLAAKIDVTNKVIPQVTINGNEQFTAKNGNGEGAFTFGYTPANYNVPVSVKSITVTGSGLSVKDGYTKDGFTIVASGLSADVSGTITAVVVVDGSEVTITKSVVAKYAESITPLIIMNTTGSAKTFGYKMGKGASQFEVATMQGHVNGVEDYSNVQFTTVDLTTTQVDVTLQNGESFLIQSRTHAPTANKYLQFVITTFAPDFDGDVLGICGGKMTSYACHRMFYGCTSLTTAPELPATTLANYCYSYLFYNCISLTTAPELPATTLADSCYCGMFYNCRGLTTAPELPATTLKGNCYSAVFYNCTKINYIKAMFITEPSTSYTNNWLSGVPASGTFVKNAAATWDLRGAYGIPKKWTVEYSDGNIHYATDMIAKNGSGTLECDFERGGEFKDKTITNVVSSNSKFTISNLTQDGFTLSCSGLTTDESTTLTIYYNGGSVESIVAATYEKEVDPRKETVGAVLCSDGSIVVPDIASDGYTVNSVDLGGKTPIGMLVIPASHMDDGKARFMSLDFMDYANPDTGSQSLPTMYWGGYGTDLSSLPNLDTCILLSGATNSYSRLGSKTPFHPSNFTVQKEDGLWYYNDANSGPAPFTPDGGINSAYRQLATGDFDGIGNTDKLIAAVTVAWQSGAVSNASGAGNYPAACCCRRYHTDGTNAGDWYLPAMGELGYIMYNAQLIDNVLTKINKIANSNSIYLWSSTECSSYGARLLSLGNGFVSYYNKHYDGYVRAFLAF